MRCGAGGVAVKAESLNLLRYPRRLQLVTSPWMVWALSGGVLGLVAGMVWGLSSQAQQAHWQQQVQMLQARQTQQLRLKTEMAERARWGAQARQAAQSLQDWQSQREQLLQLHALLTQAARDSGLQLRLWQGDERRLQLHGWLPRPEALPQLQAQLGAVGPAPWRLHSLSAGTSPGVELVLQSQPSLTRPSASAPSAPSLAPSSAPSHREGPR